MRAVAAAIYAENFGTVEFGEDVCVGRDGLLLPEIILGLVIILCLLCISKHA